MSDGEHRPRILVSDRQSAPIDEGSLVKVASACLEGEGAGACELSVSFVTVDEMADLRRRYTGEEGATDVLSFPLDEGDEEGVRLLGDVVIAPEMAAENNPNDPAAELRLLLVHGILHLLGHEHEEEDERTAMWTLQERYAGVRVP
ncbi:MAG: rRNA maturation RNase YbeY [Actinomycetota bacterium]